MQLQSTIFATALATTLALCGAASAQDTAFGESLFSEKCAICHGPAGDGDGPIAELFKETPVSLRQISLRNDGVFPFGDVYAAVDGRREIQAHGTLTMPVWGDAFTVEALPKTFHPGVEAEDIVQARILALVYYLQSIQE